ncbi:hypothetical protein Dimus_008237 [Dionaea muscipula]
MSSPSHEWSWEPRVPIHPSLLEMTHLRIPSLAPDSPEYSCQGSEESSFLGDESGPPCEIGEGDALCVSGRGVNPYASEEGATSRGLVGVPPSYPLVARLEGRSPKKLRIKLKSRSLGESSQSRPETTTLSVVDAAGTLGPLPGQGEKKVLKKALSEAENRLVQVFDQRIKEGRLWDVNMKPSLSSLQWAGIVSGSPDLSCPELELSSSSFLSIGGGGSDQLHGPDDDHVRSYVGSEKARLRTPPLRELTGVPSLDETGMTKGRRLQLPSGAFANRDRDRRSSRDAEDRPPKPPSAELSREKGVASDYPRRVRRDAYPLVPLIYKIPLVVGSQLSLWEARLMVPTHP